MVLISWHHCDWQEHDALANEFASARVQPPIHTLSNALRIHNHSQPIAHVWCLAEALSWRDMLYRRRAKFSSASCLHRCASDEIAANSMSTLSQYILK